MKTRERPKARISTYEKVMFSLIALVLLVAFGLAGRAYMQVWSIDNFVVEIKAPQEKIWRALTDPLIRPEWEWQMRSIIPSTEEKQAEGARNFIVLQRQHRSWDGGELYTHFVEGASITIERETDHDLFELAYQINETDQDGVFIVRLDMKNMPRDFVERMLLPLLGNEAVEGYSQSLRQLKYIIENDRLS